LGNSRVLSASDIERCLHRISREIMESIDPLDSLVLMGIPTRGSILAARLAETIGDLSGQDIKQGVLDVTMFRDDAGRMAVRAPAQTIVPPGGIENLVCVLVDDVLFSGRTVRAALDALLTLGRPQKVKLAVLVDRGHRELPIRPDFIGKNLPSSRSERVNVLLLETDGHEEVQVSE